MYTTAFRETVQTQLIARAEADPHIGAAALIGSLVTGGDRWSDLDLTFSVADAAAIPTVLADWTRHMVDEHGAVVLFDLPADSTIYRVFLLPGALQVDLSFTPAADFGPRSPRWRTLFGETVTVPFRTLTTPTSEIIGLAAHYLVFANTCIERGNVWQAAHAIDEARMRAMSLACRRLGLPDSYGRGFDMLPPEIAEELTGALVGSLEPGALRRSLRVVTAVLLREAEAEPEMAAKLRAALQFDATSDRV